MGKKNNAIMIIFLTLVFILGMSVIYHIMAANTHKIAQENAMVNLVDNAHEQVKTINIMFESYYYLLNTVSECIATNQSLQGKDIDYLISRMSETTQFSKILYILQNGSVYDNSTIKVNDRDYFIKAMNGENGIEKIISRHSGESALALSVPYIKNNEICGVLTGIFSEETLSSILSSQAYDGKGDVFITDKEGNVILSAINKTNLINEDNFLEVTKNVKFEYGYTYEKLIQAIDSNESGMFSCTLNNNTRIVTFIPMNSEIIPDNEWYLINIMPDSVLENEIKASNSNLSALLLGMCVLSVCFFVMIMFYFRDAHNRLEKENENNLLRRKQFQAVIDQSGRSFIEFDIATQKIINYPFKLGEITGDASSLTICDVELCSYLENNNYLMPLSISELRSFFEKINNGVSSLSTEIQIQSKNNTYVWVMLNSTTFFLGDKPKSAIISYYDCTKQRESEVAFNKWQQELDNLSRDKSSVFEWNLSKDIFESLKGDKIDYFDKLPRNSFDERTKIYSKQSIYDSDRRDYENLMNRDRLIGAFHNGVTYNTMDFRELKQDGSYRWMRLSVQVVPYPDSQDIKAFITFTDIDESKKKELELISRSEHDMMTGVLNRDAFMKKVNEVLSADSRNTHVLMMLDLDNFKLVNNTYGHDAGDEMLIEASKSMKMIMRSSDFIGRIGGDEFMIFITDVPYDIIAKRKAEQLGYMLYKRLDAQLNVSASIGISFYPRDGSNFEQLYKKADIALYDAKEHGKNSYAFYNVAMEQIGHTVNSIDDENYTQHNQNRIIESSKDNILLICDSDDIVESVKNSLGELYNITVRNSSNVIGKYFDIHRHNISAVIFDIDCGNDDSIPELLKTEFNRTDILSILLISDVSRTLSNKFFPYFDVLILKPFNEELMKTRVSAMLTKSNNRKLLLQKSYYMLQESDEERYREILNATGTLLFTYDIETRKHIADPLVSKYFDGDFMNKKIYIAATESGIISNDDITEALKLADSVAHGDKQNAEINIRAKLKTGDVHWFRLQFIRLESRFDMTRKMIITANDINDKIEATQTLKYRAEHDVLTGLYNREVFCEKAAALIENKPENYYVMACLDIDCFKILNDSFGQAEGDRVLKRIADFCRELECKYNALTCRITGDLFAAIYPYSQENINVIKNRRNEVLSLDKLQISLTFSVGRYIVKDKSLSVGAMLDRAVLAKATVKGRYDKHAAFFDENMLNKLLMEQYIIDRMIPAFNDGQFEVYYQPQYDHSNGSVIGAEALSKWHDPEKGIIPPDIFIRCFEKNGFIFTFDKFVIQTVCKKLSMWSDSSLNIVPVSVNISKYDIFCADFYDYMTSTVEKFNISPKLLQLEITEPVFHESAERIKDIVKRLRDYGFKITIDNFGSGYSAFGMLSNIKADIIKLDLRFLNKSDIEVGDTEKNGNIINSMLQLAKIMDIPVIAEGVETKNQADFLKAAGCTIMQGYYYSRPMTVSDFEKLLSTHTAKQQK